ncbi:hypothetical protein ASG87_12035 [Frateuria sp. Soil773]|uniref:DUF72 domain-containing protein n=1 Tax=Frateuria sp. Soil773 TaxID=1736407 RepID=UPI0006F4146F|nr:DUF72 domain-containing protein [Frateuria sp. Soil773]KRF02188.1 hypothetical protein ASG87_12035 [Frateuria sp. Soil773]
MGKRHTGKLRIGISGWRYAPWRGVFYPRGLPQREELHYASRQVASIELNGSFYSLQRPSSYARWYAETPRGFRFAVKAPRFITHTRRLRDVDTALANFFASGVFALREKLGPILWQCPPSLRYDEALFDAFLARLPRDTGQAASLARRHDAHLKARALLAPDRPRPLRHALEVRHPSFACAQFVALLRRHRVALVVADTAGKWPYLEDVTAGFMYLRLHGDRELYASGYSDGALDDWARRIRAWARGAQPRDAVRVGDRPPARRATRDVYCYFDNDAKVKAPGDAQALARRLGAA